MRISDKIDVRWNGRSRYYIILSLLITIFIILFNSSSNMNKVENLIADETIEISSSEIEEDLVENELEKQNLEKNLVGDRLVGSGYDPYSANITSPNFTGRWRIIIWGDWTPAIREQSGCPTDYGKPNVCPFTPNCVFQVYPDMLSIPRMDADVVIVKAGF